jgi:hypothetical protein
MSAANQDMQESQYSRAIYATSLFLFFAPIYVLSRNQTYSYDGLLFADMTEIDLARLPANIVFEWNHFLWYPTARVFYLALHALHFTVRGYQALQLFNALIGAAGVSLTFLILSELVSRPWPLTW